MIKNTRLWEVVRALATAENDVRHRVALACQILDKMHKSELPKNLWDRLEAVKNKAGAKGKLLVNGVVVKDRYDNSIISRHNRTYSNLAKEILSVYEEFNDN